MKKIIAFLIFIFYCNHLFSQQRDFEGIITYQVIVVSKQEGITEKKLKTMLAVDDMMTDYIKQGNYRLSSPVRESYYINKDKRMYLKFKNIDTLYYLDYNSDTTKVIAVTRPADQKNIAGFVCNSIIIKTSDATRTYLYAPALYMNPAYDKENLLSNFNVYTKETSSLWLSTIEDAPAFSVTYNATNVQQQTIDDAIFDLPALPLKEFSIATLMKDAEFSRPGGWNKYIIANVNAQVGARYIKIPKGEKGAIQTPIVKFMISETGQVLQAHVINKSDVHPKVAEEAIRVVMEASGWKPATIYGQKISSWLQQPFTFQVEK